MLRGHPPFLMCMSDNVWAKEKFRRTKHYPAELCIDAYELQISSFKRWLIRMAQKLGPHMVQNFPFSKWASL